MRIRAGQWLPPTLLLLFAAIPSVYALDRPDDLARIETATVAYREPGEFLLDGRPVNGPLGRIAAARPFEIMRRQVTRGEYERCVEDGACLPLDKKGDAALPVVGVSWNDAVRYAEWLSDRTGEAWRLPTDREWALAAGSRYRDDAYTEVSDPTNPARRWIAVYDAEAAQASQVDPTPLPVGSFGTNEHGIADLAGNIWEWTDTCYVRHGRDTRTGELTENENCGVRIAEGRHRAYMTSFFRDPKAGACSVGIPPANLGIRLVRERRGFFHRLQGWIGF